MFRLGSHGYLAAGSGSQIAQLLTDLEMPAPQPGRRLSPLCHMMAVPPDPPPRLPPRPGHPP